MSDLHNISEKELKALIASEPAVRVSLVVQKDGISVFATHHTDQYELTTFRGSAKRYASLSTVTKYLQGLGVDNAEIHNIQQWRPDAYVRRNSSTTLIRKAGKRA